MISLFIRSIIIAVFAVAGLWVWYAYVTEEVVHENVRHRKGQYIARVVWQRVFPWYNGVDVSVVVVDTRGKTLLRRPLLRDLDSPEAVPDKVHGLEWDGIDLVVMRSDMLHEIDFTPPQDEPNTQREKPGEP